MPSIEQTKKDILKLVQEANSIIPNAIVPHLEFMDGYPDVPKWHDFEQRVWAIGEKIRLIMNSKPKLRSDKELQDRFVEIVKNRNAKRGRQSFILLLAYRVCASYSAALLSELNDPFVDGQVIYTWRKMQKSLYVQNVSHYLNDSRKWVRDEATKYVNKYNRTAT
jgi:hypothetical protein